MLLLLGMQDLAAQCREVVSESFEGTMPPTVGGTWRISAAVTIGTVSTNARTGSKYAIFNGTNDSIMLPLIVKPSIFVMYARSTSTSGRMIVETSSSPTFSVINNTLQIPNNSLVTTGYTRFVLPVENEYVRIRDNRSGGNTSALWLDDIGWYSDTATGVWTGDLNNDWFSADNWCKGIVIDGVGQDALIPAGAPNYPIVSSSITLRNLTVNSGGSLVITGGVNKISGSITSTNGITFSTGSGILEINGSSPQTLQGSYFKDKIAMNIRISNPSGVAFVGLNDSLKLRQALSFGAGNCTLETNGNLVLLSSTGSNTARIVDMTSGGLYTGNRILGNVTVERFIPFVSGRNARWQFLSVPVKGQTINAAWQEGNAPLGNNRPGYGTIITTNQSNSASLGFDGFSPNGPGMKYYDAASSSFIGVANTSQLLDTETGYMLFVRGNRSVTNSSQSPTSTVLRATGQLFTPIDNPPPIIQVPAGKFQSVNNFYASAVNFSGLVKTGSIQDAFYLWDPSLSGIYGRGGYQTFTWDGTTYVANPGGGNFSSGNNTIESGAAFFVKDIGTGGTIQFTEAAKVNQARMVFRTAPGSQYSSIRASISILDSIQPTLLDGVVSYFSPDFSPSVNAMDIPKISLDEGISIRRHNQMLSAEYSYHDSTFYSVNKLRKASYQLEFNFTEMNRVGKVCILYDRFLNSSKTIPMTGSRVISFQVTDDPASYDPARFYLVIKKQESAPQRPFLASNP